MSLNISRKDEFLKKYIIYKNEMKSKEEKFNLIYEYTFKTASFYVFKHLKDINEVDDVLQEIYFYVYHNFEKINNISSFYSWFMKIVHGKTTDFIRKKVITNVPMELNENVNENLILLNFKKTDNPEKFVEFYEEKIQLQNAIEKLPEKQKTVVKLFYFSDLTISEISDVIGDSQKIISKRLYDARNSIRKIYEEKTFKTYSIIPFNLYLEELLQHEFSRFNFNTVKATLDTIIRKKYLLNIFIKAISNIDMSLINMLANISTLILIISSPTFLLNANAKNNSFNMYYELTEKTQKQSHLLEAITLKNNMEIAEISTKTNSTEENMSTYTEKTLDHISSLNISEINSYSKDLALQIPPIFVDANLMLLSYDKSIPTITPQETPIIVAQNVDIDNVDLETVPMIEEVIYEEEYDSLVIDHIQKAVPSSIYYKVGSIKNEVDLLHDLTVYSGKVSDFTSDSILDFKNIDFFITGTYTIHIIHENLSYPVKIEIYDDVYPTINVTSTLLLYSIGTKIDESEIMANCGVRITSGNSNLPISITGYNDINWNKKGLYYIYFSCSVGDNQSPKKSITIKLQ